MRKHNILLAIFYRLESSRITKGVDRTREMQLALAGD
jgi:hypothetical protein